MPTAHVTVSRDARRTWQQGRGGWAERGCDQESVYAGHLKHPMGEDVLGLDCMKTGMDCGALVSWGNVPHLSLPVGIVVIKQVTHHPDSFVT